MLIFPALSKGPSAHWIRVFGKSSPRVFSERISSPVVYTQVSGCYIKSTGQGGERLTGGRDIDETSTNIFVRPDQSLAVVCRAMAVAGRLSREAAFDHDVAWYENDGALAAPSFWRNQALAGPAH